MKLVKDSDLPRAGLHKTTQLLLGVVMMGSAMSAIASDIAVSQNSQSKPDVFSGELDKVLKNLAPSKECSVTKLQLTDRVAPKNLSDLQNPKISYYNDDELAQCIISPIKAHELWKRKKVQFVDVRPEKDFFTANIPGSLNMPEYAVKAKGFLKRQSFVLLNRGYIQDDLVINCLTLKQQGFVQVRVLDGGINRWSRQNYEIQGNTDIAQFEKLDAAQFVQAQRENDWPVVNLGLDAKQMHSFFPGRTLLNGKSSTEKYLKKHKGKVNGLFVLQASATPSSVMSGILKPYPGLSVFYLKADFKDYKTYLQNNMRMLEKLAKPKRVKACGG